MSARRPFTVRLFALMARVLVPGNLRRECGEELEATFEDLYREASSRSRLTAARLVSRDIYHLIGTSVLERIVDSHHDVRGSAPAPANRHAKARSMDSFLHDVRYGIRALLKRPSLTLIAAASLAIGIGANATIFGGVDIFLFRPLPLPEPDRLVQIWSTNEERGWPRLSLSLPDALDYRVDAETMDIAIYDYEAVNLAGVCEPERLSDAHVSPDFFRFLGFAPSVGRGFSRGEERSGTARIAC